MGPSEPSSDSQKPASTPPGRVRTPSSRMRTPPAGASCTPRNRPLHSGSHPPTTHGHHAHADSQLPVGDGAHQRSSLCTRSVAGARVCVCLLVAQTNDASWGSLGVYSCQEAVSCRNENRHTTESNLRLLAQSQHGVQFFLQRDLGASQVGQVNNHQQVLERVVEHFLELFGIQLH